MASSTTRPIASTIARSVNTLMEKPKKYRTKKLPTREIGTVIMGISVVRPRGEKEK
jgi:hypothetical protein